MYKHFEICNFIDIFKTDKEDMNVKLRILNKYGRGDAHAKNIPDEDMQLFRGSMSWLEKIVNDLE
jgi:hypothetical protein